MGQRTKTRTNIKEPTEKRKACRKFQREDTSGIFMFLFFVLKRVKSRGVLVWKKDFVTFRVPSTK